MEPFVKSSNLYTASSTPMRRSALCRVGPSSKRFLKRDLAVLQPNSYETWCQPCSSRAEGFGFSLLWPSMLAEPIPSAIWCSRLSKYHQETERHRNVGAVPGSMRRLVRPPCLSVGRLDAERLSASSCSNPHLHCHCASSNLDESKGEYGYIVRSYGLGPWQCFVHTFQCSRSVFCWLREACGRKPCKQPVCQVLSASVPSSEGRVRRWPFYLPGSQHVVAGVLIQSGGSSKTNSSSRQDFAILGIPELVADNPTNEGSFFLCVMGCMMFSHPSDLHRMVNSPKGINRECCLVHATNDGAPAHQILMAAMQV